ncbi:MAG TPA: hypothetical protein VFL66_10075 [Gaiellaceae bacterium]|nr:hypothetical protein [Gaiellaceae bacterium]
MRRLLLALLGAAVLAPVAAAAAPPRVDFARLPGLQQGPPPWDNGTRTLPGRLPHLRLDALSEEQLAFHIHQHLDLWVNGRKVTVPAQIGIDLFTFQPFITELHTHDTTGIIHVESAKRVPYTLGQLFGEWGVRLDASHVGRYRGTVRWWVNGTRRDGDPASLVLASHQEIAVALGRKPAHVPGGYAFPPGD